MNIALILSGGTGMRLGTDIPKQYIEIKNRSVISYCMEQFAKHNGIDYIQVVADRQWHDTILKCLEKYDYPQKGRERKFCGFSKPGENRQLSIYHGLEDIIQYASETDVVMIHDAARPLISAQLITDSLNAVEKHEGVLPVLSMKDTVYKSEDGKKVSALLDRDEIYAGQAPETFRIGRYFEANKRLFPDRIRLVNGSAEPAVMAGMDVVMIPGDEINFKITTKDDLKRFSEMIEKSICKY